VSLTPRDGCHPVSRQTRRSFVVALAGALALCIDARALAQLATQRRTPVLPKTVAGVRLPDTVVALAALDLAWNACPPFLFNHCLRTFLFGVMLAEHDAPTYDSEIIFVAAALHDLGLTQRYATPEHPFEMDGADAAKEFLAARGVSAARAERAWNAIALHTSILVDHQEAQIGIVGNGAGADVFGSGIKSLQAERVAEVVRVFPRLSFNTGFRDLLVDHCHRKPLSQRGTWLDNFCRVHNPGVAYPDIEKRMLEAWPGTR